MGIKVLYTSQSKFIRHSRARGLAHSSLTCSPKLEVARFLMNHGSQFFFLGNPATRIGGSIAEESRFTIPVLGESCHLYPQHAFSAEWRDFYGHKISHPHSLLILSPLPSSKFLSRVHSPVVFCHNDVQVCCANASIRGCVNQASLLPLATNESFMLHLLSDIMTIT